MYFYLRADEVGKYYVFIAQTAVGFLTYLTLYYMKTTARLVGAIVFVPLSVVHIWLGDTADVFAGLVIIGVFAAVVVHSQLFLEDFRSLLKSKFDIINLSEDKARLASLDMLTGLPNRRHYFQILKSTLNASRTDDSQVFTGVVDLDGFKPVNDTYGHVVGDEVLRVASQRLLTASEHIFSLCRIGGDEFGFFVHGEKSDNDLIRIGASLMDVLREPIEVGTISISVGCSVGIARYSAGLEEFEDEADFAPEELYEQADIALYQAKRSGKSQTVIFSNEHKKHQLRTGKIIQGLKSDHLENELYLVFHPMVNLESGRAHTFEALARWKSAELGFVSPAEFIPIAEQTGFMKVITPMLLKRCLKQMKDWPVDVRLSFNLSGQDLCSPDTILQILQMLEADTASAARLSFEVTESSMIQDYEMALAHIRILKACGAHIALDDFGTGFSSLAYVNGLPLDKLKVDKSFVENIDQDESSRNIVRLVISLCRDLNLECVVEGVETREQLDALVLLGCTNIQGYYFSKPLNAEDVPAFLEKKQHHAGTKTAGRAVL